MEEEAKQINFIPYNTEAEALAKIEAIDSKYSKSWIPRSTESYANPLERADGKFYLPVYGRYVIDFTEEELSRGVEELPEPIQTEEQ